MTAKVDRVVFLLDSVFTRRDYERFGFDAIQSRGYAVEAWGFSPVLKPRYYEVYTPPDAIDSGQHRLFRTRVELVEALSTLSDKDIVVWMIGFGPENMFIMEILHTRQATYGFCNLGLLPGEIENSRFVERVRRFLKDPVAVGATVFRRLRTGPGTMTRHAGNGVHSNFVLLGGTAARTSRRYPRSASTTIIDAHTFDYDRYLAEEERGSPLDAGEDQYALFLDEDAPFHSDYLHRGSASFCPPEIYYPQMNEFFTYFERETGLPVTVAAHPRANYSGRENPYGNRRLVTGRTEGYTKRAAVVLTHGSTAIAFSIMYKKPLHFIDSTSFDGYFRKSIKTIATSVGKQPLVISGITRGHELAPTVDEDLYRQYFDSYIKAPGTPNKPVWDIFCDYIATGRTI